MLEWVTDTRLRETTTFGALPRTRFLRSCGFALLRPHDPPALADIGWVSEVPR